MDAKWIAVLGIIALIVIILIVFGVGVVLWQLGVFAG